MKKNSFFIYCLSLFLVVDAYAQRVIGEKLDSAIIEVVYRRIKVTDTLKADIDYKDQLLTLRAGKVTSSFYAQGRKMHDSLMHSPNAKEYLVNVILKEERPFAEAAKHETEVIFKNYPIGKITVHNYYASCSWSYEEDWEKPVWEITDSTATLSGYNCMLATTDYRGRRWYAWFTPDIPIPEGPWKLCGLPGLILEARDAKNHYRYMAQSVRLNPKSVVDYFDYANERLKTNRIRSLQDRQKDLKVDLRYAILSSAESYGLKPRKVEKRKVIPHRNYDFEETDYPHK